MKTLTPLEQQTLALAAIFQAAECVSLLANDGRCDEHDSQSLVESLFVFSPENTLDVYKQDIRGLTLGLNRLSKFSSSKNQKRLTEITKYALSMVNLEKQLKADESLLSAIRSRLDHVARFNDFSHTPTNTAEEVQLIDFHSIHTQLSGIYQDTISTLNFRIQVTGNMEKLTQTPIADHIRALLFSGIRAAMLWQQVGGSRWHLIFKRKRIEQTAKQLLDAYC